MSQNSFSPWLWPWNAKMIGLKLESKFLQGRPSVGEVHHVKVCPAQDLSNLPVPRKNWQSHPILNTKLSANKSKNKCKRKSCWCGSLVENWKTVLIQLSTVLSDLVISEHLLHPSTHLLPHQQTILCPTDDAPCVGGRYATTIAHRKRS